MQSQHGHREDSKGNAVHHRNSHATLEQKYRQTNMWEAVAQKTSWGLGGGKRNNKQWKHENVFKNILVANYFKDIFEEVF